MRMRDREIQREKESCEHFHHAMPQVQVALQG